MGPENIHTHPMGGHSKFRGCEGSQKPKIFKGKYGAELEFSDGREDSNQKTFHGRGMDIFWNNTIYVKWHIVWVVSQKCWWGGGGGVELWWFINPFKREAILHFRFMLHKPKSAPSDLITRWASFCFVFIATVFSDSDNVFRCRQS